MANLFDTSLATVEEIEPAVFNHLSADIEGDTPSLSVASIIREFLLQPVWLFSFAFHLALLLLLAAWVFPQLGDNTIFVFAEQQATAELEDVEMVVLEMETLDLLVDTEIQQEENLPLNEFENFELVDEVAGEPDEFGMQGELIEHSAEFADVMANEGTEGTPDSLLNQQAAIGIQEKVVAAGGQSGEVQFSLVWKTKSDLDLHVVAPGGDRIHYLFRESVCRGRLDVDRNANDDFLTDEPVENVRWLRGRPLEGRYTVMIHLFAFRGFIPKIDYDLMAKTGEDLDIQSTEISLTKRIHVFRYVYIPGEIEPRFRKNRIKKYRDLQEREERLATKLLDKIEQRSAREVERLWVIIRKYPHTDAAIEALQRIGNSSGKK